MTPHSPSLFVKHYLIANLADTLQCRACLVPGHVKKHNRRLPCLEGVVCGFPSF